MFHALFAASAFLLAAMLVTSPVRAEDPTTEPTIRVRVIYTLDQITVIPSAEYEARAAGAPEGIKLPGSEAAVVSARDGKVHVSGAAGGDGLSAEVVEFSSKAEGAALLIEKVPFGIGWWWAGIEDRLYEGKVDARVAEDGKLTVVVTLPLEEYLRGVVPSEIGGDSPTEALKAQAVAARSETVVALRDRLYGGAHYDVCADVECQVYSGAKKRTDATDAAIKATRGLVLTSEGAAIGAYYASNCGGSSENIENVWPVRSGHKPYWSARFDSDEQMSIDLTDEKQMREWIASEPDVYCNPKKRAGMPNWSTKNFRWVVETSAEDLTKFVARRKDIGRVVAIRPLQRGQSGRLIKAVFVGENGELEIGPELAIRQVWDPPLRGAGFVVDVEGPAERPEKFIMRGAGWGHGVGMCQTGAVSRALAGQDFKAILDHYYHGSELKAAY